MLECERCVYLRSKKGEIASFYSWIWLPSPWGFSQKEIYSFNFVLAMSELKKDKFVGDRLTHTGKKCLGDTRCIFKGPPLSFLPSFEERGEME